MSSETQPAAAYGCFALFVSTLLASMLLMFGTLYYLPPSVELFVAVFVITALVSTALGMPVFAVLSQIGRVHPRYAALVGAAVGGLFPLTTAANSNEPELWISGAIYTAVGAISGIVFYLTLTASRNPARNIAIITAIAGASISLTPLARAIVTPAPNTMMR